MSDFVWPSDSDRAENDELNRVCEYLEEVLDTQEAARAQSDQGAEPVAFGIFYKGVFKNTGVASTLQTLSQQKIMRGLRK